MGLGIKCDTPEGTGQGVEKQLKTADEKTSATQILANFVQQAEQSPLPETVARKVKLHILDTLGCIIAFADLPWSQSVARYAETSGSAQGRCTVAHAGINYPAGIAAFANASFGHGFEMDDTEMRSASHPGVVVVPAALAVGQEHSVSGAQFLAAVATGYEVMLRVALSGVGMMKRGFHTTAVAGPFGAAAAAAVLLGQDATVASHALGIAASKAAGITEYTGSGGSVKRVHAGFAAQSGIEAAQLAQFGVTAPTRALEGERGLLSAVSDTPDLEILTQHLGEDWTLLGTGLKPYCCCAGQHAVIDAVAHIMNAARHLDISQIKRIHVVQNPREVAVVGRIVEPDDVTAAQFSAAFGIALRLTGGSNGYSNYLNADLKDPVLLSLARKVSYTSTPANAPIPGNAPAQVRIELLDGTEHEAQVHYARGSVQVPLDEAAVIAKFRDLTQDLLGVEQSQRLQRFVLNIERAADLTELAKLIGSVRA